MKNDKSKVCPQCGKEMFRHGKRSNFIIMLLVSCIIWPMFLFLPFIGFVKPVYTCYPCKKSYKAKELAKMEAAQ